MRFGLILILFLLSACAQVGVLSGGAKDETAPVPNMEKMSPKNASTNFNGKELVIPFNEFIKLNNPSETMVVVPPNIKPMAKVKNKTLYLSWNDDLSPNTTYAFYLNGTVQDTKENNDSLMAFVFSTGESIDSLTVQYFVRDAFTNEPVKGAIVGLYESFSDTIRPTYFAQTDATGAAQLRYLKTGKYDVVAFEDKNKDLKHQINERMGFKEAALELTGIFVDSVPIRLFTPEETPQITGFSFNAPGSFVVSANRNLEKSVFYLNGEKIRDKNVHYFSTDSLLLPFSMSDTSQYTLIVENENWSDTTSISITQKEKSGSLRLQVDGGNEILPKKPIVLFASAELKSVVVPLIQVINAQDSSQLTLGQTSLNGNHLEMNFEREKTSNANVLFLPGSLVDAQGPNSDTILLKLTCLLEKELGSMDVDVSDFASPLVLEILLGKKLVASIQLGKEQRKHHFSNLKPGEYSFRLVLDENENGKWDVGNRALGLQPEIIQKFQETKKVRANWDLEVILKQPENGAN
jgi:uncharacterized protein (DUF2141 family)